MLGAHRRFSQAPLNFNAPHNALVFSTAWLARSAQPADPLLLQHLLRHIEVMRRCSNQDFHQTARQLLCDTRSSIETIAALLGYSDVTAFNRALSQWEGVPPAKWRRSRTAGGQDTPDDRQSVPPRQG